MKYFQYTGLVLSITAQHLQKELMLSPLFAPWDHLSQQHRQFWLQDRDLSQVLFTQLQPKMDNLATSISALFLSKIHFSDGRRTALQDRLDVYFLKLNIQGKFRQKDSRGREEGKNINNLVLSLLI